MVEELAQRKVIVDAKRKECSSVITQMKERSSEVERMQKQCSETEKQLVEDNKRISFEKAEAENALAEAEPALAEAALALNELNKDDIAEIRAFQKPPDAVLAVCQCVMELRPTGKEDPSQGWKGAKVMMSDPNFLAKSPVVSQGRNQGEHDQEDQQDHPIENSRWQERAV